MTADKLIAHQLYQADLLSITKLKLPWSELNKKTILISGATGLLGKFLIDALMFLNNIGLTSCQVLALGRNTQKAADKFQQYWKNSNFHFMECDISDKLPEIPQDDVDYVCHLASATHPHAYATEPISTITTNILGTKNLLDLASSKHTRRVIFASTCEIYGENRGDTELFDETYCGFLDSNTLRAGYPESKRCGEALCQAFRLERNIDIVIPRFSRTFGPTMLLNDSKASSQFILDGVYGQDIRLKSSGNQYFSYMYVADAVGALLTLLFKAHDGEAYNVANTQCDIKLKDFAHIVAGFVNTRVVFEQAGKTEQAGFSPVTIARQNGAKLASLGWTPHYSLQSGIKRTIKILRDCR